MKRKAGRWMSCLVGAAMAWSFLVAGPGWASSKGTMGSEGLGKGTSDQTVKGFWGTIFGSPLPSLDFRRATRIQRKPACPMIAYNQYTHGISGSSDISLATIAGSGLRVLAESLTDQFLQWFPSGREVLYRDEGGNLVAVDTVGAVRREIVAAPWAFSPTLSPDGTRVAYIPESNPNALVEIEITTSGDPRFIEAFEIVNMMNHPDSLLDDVIYYVTYSHAGDKIAFLHHHGGTRTRRLYIINRDGTGLRLVDGDISVLSADPVWSADDAYLAYANWDIYVAKVDTLEKIDVSSGVRGNISPDVFLRYVLPLWRGDTHSLYFTGLYQPDIMGFAEISAEGSFGPQSVIRKGVFQSRSPLSGDLLLEAISPDGRFAAIVDHQQHRLFIEEIGGTYLMEVPNPSGRPYGMVAWQPGSYAGLDDGDGDGVYDACGD